MGRFTAYDQNGRMVADFDKSEYDFMRRYGRTPEEVLDENAKLWTLLKHESEQEEKLRELVAKMAKALRIDSEWCDRECIVVFGCDGMDECPIVKELRELGVEVFE